MTEPMGEPMGEPPAPRFRIDVPDDLEAGAYANFLAVWHSAHEFTLDFGVTGQPRRDPAGETEVATRVTARVKVPPTVVFEILRALNDNMTRYEAAFGPIRQPGEG